MSTHAIVLLKRLAHGKRRLAGTLVPAQRERLILTMATHVVAVAASVAEISRVHVLTGEKSLVLPFPNQIYDAGLGLNAAVAHAAPLLESLGAQSMLVLAADLPFVAPEDIEHLLVAGRKSAAVFAPDLSRTGTNAMLITPPMLLQPCFGERSLAAHLTMAARACVSADIVQRPALAFDIDTPADLSSLVAHGGHRYEFLAAESRAFA